MSDILYNIIVSFKTYSGVYNDKNSLIELFNTFVN